MLSQVNRYLKLNRRAAVQDMAAVLDISPDALRAILHKLQARGNVRRLPEGTPCGGSCGKCSPESIEMYEWNG